MNHIDKTNIRKGMSLIEVLVASVILSIVAISSMLYLSNSEKIIIRNEKALLANNIYQEFIEKIRNFESRVDYIDPVSGIYDLITSGDNIIFKPGNPNLNPPVPAIEFGPINWRANKPLEILVEGNDGVIIKFTIEFDIRLVKITESTFSADILKLTATIKWIDGELIISTYTEY